MSKRQKLIRTPDEAVYKSGEQTMEGLLRLTAGLNFNESGGDTLSDYEVGTWTVTDASGAGLTFTYQDCNYIMIGKIVVLNFRFTFATTSSTTINQIGNIPFNIAGTTNRQMGVTLSGKVRRNSSTTITLISNEGSSIQNQALSAQTIIGTLIYERS